MSFKDQFLKAGLVNKKQVRKSNQKAKKDRKKDQGSREKLSVVHARDAKRKAEALKKAKRERHEIRKERERIREREEAVRRVGQILSANRTRFRGGNQKFWHPSPCRRYLLRLDLPESIAFDLHRGNLGIAYVGPKDVEEPDVVLVSRSVVERILKLDPSRILFHNASRPKDIGDQLLPPESV
ncbi:MAG: DUF2058 family protein [Myxococcota bacterium]|nr:DUF2058 family protein [Myxococcota bacterium]